MRVSGRRVAAVAAVLGAAALAGCAEPAIDRGMSMRPAPGGEAAAMAATFRYMFANNASALQARAASYCIGTGRPGALAEPPPGVIGMLGDVGVRVTGPAGCRAGERVTDTAGNPALIFHLETIGCETNDLCLFAGGYSEANLSGSGGMYRAQRFEGRWMVMPEGPQAIS